MCVCVCVCVKSNWFKISISFTVSLFSLCSPDRPIEGTGVWKLSTFTVLGALCALSFSNVSSMNESAFAFAAWMFRIESYSWWFFPLTSMKCPSVSLLMTLGWKSILSDFRIVTPDCLLRPLACKVVFQPFTLR